MSANKKMNNKTKKNVQTKKNIKKENKVIVKDNNKLILSLIVILFYFAWPQIVNAFKSILSS